MVSRSLKSFRLNGRWRLAAYLPARAHVLRDHQKVEVEARTLVPGDVLVISEGDRVCADGRVIDGELDLDLSSLTGESLPAHRCVDDHETDGSKLEARDWVCSVAQPVSRARLAPSSSPPALTPNWAGSRR